MLNATGYGYFQVSILADFFFQKKPKIFRGEISPKTFF